MAQIYASKTNEIQKYETEHENEVRHLAGECMVLLENDGVLPFSDKIKKIALYGTGARHTVKGGTGSGDVNVRKTVSIARGLEEAGFEIVTEDWLDRYDRDLEEAQKTYLKKLKDMSDETGEPSVILGFKHPFQEPEQPIVEETDIKEADAAIYVLARNSGEGKDRRAEKGDYYLSDRELQNIRFMTENYSNCVVLLNTGGVIDLTELRRISGVQAILLTGQTGSYDDYPSSRTFSYRDGNLDDEYYSDGIYVGYRYFDTFGIMPLYCFGYGKGYTDFSLVTKEVTADEKLVKVEVEVTNIGKVYPGREVIQVYYSAPDGVMEKPTQELAGFAKTKLLMPGEKEVVTVTFATEDMASYDSYDAAWVMEEGEYTIRVGNSSRTTEVAAIIDLDETVQTVLLKNVMKDKEFVKEIHHMVPIFDLELDDTPFMRPILIYAENFKKKIMEYEVIRTTLEDKRPDEILTLEDVKKGAASLEELVAQLTVEEMADLCVGTERLEEGGNVIGSSSACVPGAAGDTTSALIEKRKIPNLILADGPAGLRLQTHFKTDKEGNKLPGGEQFGMEIAPFAKEQPEGAQDYYQYCTAIPIATTLAQSWDVDLIKRMGEIVGEEMEQFHIHLWLAPGMNIHRNPLCGRNFEYYSEDPYVSGTIAAAMTEGVQSNYGCGTTIKHFACNNQEDNRMGSDSVVSERALREVYLKGFEIAIRQAQPMSIMTSYNLINGVHAANNYDLCTESARNEWGFKGAIMTDWTTTEQGDNCTASGCMRAGNDLVMPGCFGDHDNMHKELAEGTLKIEDLKACIARLVSMIWKSNQYQQ